jgi:RHS repeat-associated protein
MQSQNFILLSENYFSKNFNISLYSFNGQEKDDEINDVSGADLAFEYRIYDSRLCRFLIIDPLASKFPFYSPYHFASNQPISAKELEGLESSNDLNASAKITYNMGANKKSSSFSYSVGFGFTSSGSEFASGIGLAYNSNNSVVISGAVFNGEGWSEKNSSMIRTYNSTTTSTLVNKFSMSLWMIGTNVDINLNKKASVTRSFFTGTKIGDFHTSFYSTDPISGGLGLSSGNLKVGGFSLDISGKTGSMSYTRDVTNNYNDDGDGPRTIVSNFSLGLAIGKLETSAPLNLSLSKTQNSNVSGFDVDNAYKMSKPKRSFNVSSLLVTPNGP